MWLDQIWGAIIYLCHQPPKAQNELFILGIQDIFVCFMLWFMMENNKPDFMENRNTGELYQVLDVLKD